MEESHQSSPAAFVEGGIQDACDDACSICLEVFCDSDPSTVTGCKHEFHLQCILEWCQRSSQCPMCWRPIVLKDSTSQELMEAVERERNLRVNSERNATVFHHPTIGGFDLPIGESEAELEERIFQHLAAAAMNRAHHIARREGHRGRSSAQGHPQFLVFSAQPNTSAGSVSVSSAEDESSHAVVAAGQLISHSHTGEEHTHRPPHIVSGRAAANRPALSNSRIGQSTADSNSRAGPSDLQAFSETLKSRLSAVSMRYKESITKSTRGWKERFFSRSSSMAELGSEVRREVHAGIASVSRMMERLDTRESTKPAGSSVSHGTEVHSSGEPRNETVSEDHTNISPSGSSTSASCATTSGDGPN